MNGKKTSVDLTRAKMEASVWLLRVQLRDTFVFVQLLTLGRIATLIWTVVRIINEYSRINSEF